MNIINNDCLVEMRLMQSNSFSCIVTDPPYGLGFMGKDWDAGLPHKDIWAEALRICKPGAHLLAFGGTRTYHRLTCAIEDAGWQIRDCLMWIYGSGFPKSHNHFGLEGYGTALKPAYEPIIMAMKPCDGTFKENVEKWGQGGVNIAGCRIIPTDQDAKAMERVNTPGSGRFKSGKFGACGEDGFGDKSEPYNTKAGRWPANILFDEEAAQVLDEQSGLGASRFFYCAKASSSERDEGLEGMPLQKCGMMEDDNYPIKTGSGNLRDTKRQNNHPTVKPLKLMEYLIKLVMPPHDEKTQNPTQECKSLEPPSKELDVSQKIKREAPILLDPFAGSGTTILAAQRLGFNAIGIEKSADYCAIAEQRIANN